MGEARPVRRVLYRRSLNVAGGGKGPGREGSGGVATAVVRATVFRKVDIPRWADSCSREICASSWASLSSMWARLLSKPSSSVGQSSPSVSRMRARRLSRISTSRGRSVAWTMRTGRGTQASLNLSVGPLDDLGSLDRVGVMTGNRGRWSKIDGERGVEDVTLLILEWLGEQGVNAMIRMDAERLADNAPAWTFAASGGALVHGIRADGRTVQQCMSVALVRLGDSGLSVPF